MNNYTISTAEMMIPKNSRSRKKQISNHDTHSTASSSNAYNNDLPIIARASNHTPINSRSDHSSESSWIELDFNKTEHKHNKSNDIEISKPVSSVNISMDLEDDEESKSSTTSKLSEDFTDKGNKVSKDENDDDHSVTSFASESSFAVDVPLDEFFVDSPMPSSSKPTSDKTGKKPTSNRSDSNGTKPSSERSKPVSERSKKSKKHVSPRNKASKKKSKSPMPVQARKRLTEHKHGETTDEFVKEHKKRISPKPKRSSRSSSNRRSSSSSSKHRSTSQALPPPPPPPLEDDEQLLALMDEPSASSTHKKKAKKSSSKSPRTRRRRLRSEDLVEGGDEPNNKKPSSSSSLEAKSRRTRAKSKSKHRKTPSRSSSNPDIAAARELRRRMKKKAEENDSTTATTKSRSASRAQTKRSSNGHESEDDTSKMTSKSRSSSGTRKKRSSNGHESEDDMSNINTSRHKEGKKKTRSKSSDPKNGSRDSEAARRRRKKKPSSKTASTDAPDEVLSPMPPPSEAAKPSALDEDDDIDPHLQPETGRMEIMTYSFHCRDDEEDNNNKVEGGGNWINSANSSSSSLSYNSFAQFSLDVGAMTGLVTDVPDTPNGDNGGVGIIPDLDASVASYGTMDASVVFMSGSKSGNRVSLLSATHSFDPEEELDDGKTGRSARSVPVGSSNGIKPEKQLRRRLKKGEGSTQQQNAEIKKKVRRAKSNNLEQIKESLLAANEQLTRKGIQRTKSLSEALEQGNSTLVASKASRRKKGMSSTMSQASANTRNTTKSKSGHGREISRSPKPRSPKKIQPDKFAAYFDGIEATSSVKDVAHSDNKLSQNQPTMRSPKPSPTQKNSPMNRGVRRTFSNPLAAMGLHSSSGDRRALLSTSANDSDSDEDYSTHSAKKSFLPKRGLDRTPSQILGGVRDKLKKTFSVSGHGKNTFDVDLDDVALGMRTENGYMGVKERRRLMAESAGRRNQVKNSLYASMDDSDSDVDISSTRYDSEDESGHCKSIGHASVSSEQRRHKQTGPPRRVNSLPMHRRSPHG